MDRVVAGVDPALVVARRERAVADRQLRVRPDADGSMCSVWGALPAADGVTPDQRLRALALGGGAPRTPGPSSSAAPTRWWSWPADCGPSRTGAVDLPGVLSGFGVVDPGTVRTLAADARWQRLLTLDGRPVAAPESRYRPSTALARLVRARDGHCRFPGCTTPARSCDLDHVVPSDHEAPDRAGRPSPTTSRAGVAGTTG